MNLAIDIGNSFTHFGLYRGNKLVESFELPTHAGIKTVQFHSEYIEKYSTEITKAGISTVVPERTPLWIKYITNHLILKPVIINNKSKLPIRLKVKNRTTIGADRLCYAVFGYEYFKRKENVIICGLGTANTYNIVLKNGDFIGGIIAPGVITSSIALNINTGKLPLLKYSEFKFGKSVIGKDTASAIQSGLMNYMLFGTEGIIKAIKKEYKRDFKVIITGGSAKLLKKKLSIKAHYVENAVLDGINMILNYQK